MANTASGASVKCCLRLLVRWIVRLTFAPVRAAQTAQRREKVRISNQVAWLLNLVGPQIAKEKAEKKDKEKEWKTVGPKTASARTIQVRLQRVQDQLAVAVQSGRQGSVEAHLRRLGWIAATAKKLPPPPLEKLAVRQQMLATKVEDDDEDDDDEEEEEEVGARLLSADGGRRVDEDVGCCG
jgi:hypothetical protein